MVPHVIGHVNCDQMSKPVSAKADHSKVTALVKLFETFAETMLLSSFPYHF